MCSCSLLFFTQRFHCLFTSVGNAFQLSWRCGCPAYGLIPWAEWSVLGSPCKKGWNQILFAVGSVDFCLDMTRRSHSLCLLWIQTHTDTQHEWPLPSWPHDRIFFPASTSEFRSLNTLSRQAFSTLRLSSP